MPARHAGLRRFAPLALIIAVLAFGYLMGWQRYFTLQFLAESQQALSAHVTASPVLSRAGFFATYAVAVAVSFPAASVLTIFAGFLFGWLQGGLLVAGAATLGASALFLAARSAFGDALRSRVGGFAKAMAEGFERDAFNYLLALRLAPVFPFFVVNIVPALFKVPLPTYATATILGILPGTFAYAFLGQGVGASLDAARAAGTMVSVADLVTPQLLGAFFALGVVALIPVVIKRLRQRG
ncbi:MAG: TVP38/TMEM64 family protein [Rhizobiaceae bacterium]|nr:TVP38/TMEM64 family protein [Rhizobiaceae bacterium]